MEIRAAEISEVIKQQIAEYNRSWKFGRPASSCLRRRHRAHLRSRQGGRR
jgi:hypothetical protein